MADDARVAFFDRLAAQWDGWEDLTRLRVRLDARLEELGVGGDDSVLDVGCGTGNLTHALVGRLAPRGRVVAVDIAPAMLAAARRKVVDPRVTWRQADASSLPVPSATFDHVFCFAVWPHFDDPAVVAREIHRVLRDGGCLYVWHAIGRRRVNDIHREAGDPVSGDVLQPAAETARLLGTLGYRVLEVVDDEERYFVAAEKVAGRPEPAQRGPSCG